KSKSVRMKEALVKLETKHSEIQSATHESEINRNNSQKDLENLQSEVKRLKERKNSIGAQRESGSRERQDLGQQNTSLKEEHSRTEEDKIQAEQALAERRNQLKDHRKNIDEKLEEFNRVKVLMASLKGKRENILSEIKRSGLQQENLRHRIAQRENERLENSGKIAEYEKVIKNLEKQILESAGEEDRLKENLKNLEATLEEKEESLDQIEKESRELFKRVQDIMEEISRIELKQSELKIQVSHIEEKAFEDFNVSRDELLRTYTGEVDERETADELAAFKEKISKLGEVNLAALSEFTQVNERYEFLAKQQEDLAESILTLHETIDKINLTTHKLFLETFDQVNKHFSELFGRLFGGGKAEMSLCDPDNPLESGVDISASPLGKKMLHLSLLSGGEKAMTAIAMVFAIFKVRPSPFCLLDEVDAPLDDANVIRFQEILKEMSNETQFIMITHNQRTMSFADTLYGVTMEERGVSKVVSVHLN
ncbi:MAG: chromosome segregation protein SMC, partial [Nitrospinae bacterium]|nr:chromosome segregation protein SMC [Nitrospinota bacterium]